MSIQYALCSLIELFGPREDYITDRPMKSRNGFRQHLGTLAKPCLFVTLKILNKIFTSYPQVKDDFKEAHGYVLR